MDQNTFNSQLKDLMQHFYDTVALETHPLAGMVKPPPEYGGSRGDYLRGLVLEAIDRLKPANKNLPAHAVEWRPYQILSKRYVEGVSLQALSSALSLSDRQVRRDHGRALQALSGRLWDQIASLPPGDAQGERPAVSRRTPEPFRVQLGLLDLNEVLTGIRSILQKRVEDDGFQLEINLSPLPLPCLGDRVVVRQILISLFNLACHLHAGTGLQVTSALEDHGPAASFRFQVDDQWAFWYDTQGGNSREYTRSWSERIRGTLIEELPGRGVGGSARLGLALPGGAQPVLMVVDDQQSAIRLYQRYLSHLAYDVVGITDPVQVVSMARQAQPLLVILDVMMPQVDGWEILQALQLEDATRHIPVVVCSAWDEPELAKSLGASEFLKKPITQRDLLGVLQRLNLPA